MKTKISGLDKKNTERIIEIITNHKQSEKIMVYGSRAKGSFKESSDIDIAIFGKDWTDTDINIVKNMVDELVKIPLKIDIVNFYSLKKERLKQNILKEGRILYEYR